MLNDFLPVFYLNDDVTMRSIMSGAYTGSPDGHAVYMRYPLSWVLSLLYRIVDGIPWMEFFFVVCIIAGVVAVWQSMQKENVLSKCLAMAIVVTMSVPLLFYMHYTLVAAYMAGIGIFLYGKERKIGTSVLFLCLAYMIRSQVFALALPFWLIAVLWRGTEVLRKYGRAFLCLILVVAISSGVHTWAYSTGEWSGYTEYNEVRTELYDYTDFLSTAQYVENPGQYGMTDAQSKIYSSYNLLLDDSIDAQSMQILEDAVANGMDANNGGSGYVKDCLKKYYIYIRYDDSDFHFVLLTMYLAFAISLVMGRAWRKLFIVGCLGCGRSAIWLYLIWQGRFPERVRDSLFYIELLLLLGMWLTNEISSKRKTIGSVCLLCVILLFGVGHWSETANRVKAVNNTQKQWDCLVEYCENESERLYLVDVFSTVAYAGRLFENDPSNMQLLGGWLSGSPIANSKMQNAEKVSLIVRSDREYEWMQPYFEQKYGAGDFSATPLEISEGGITFFVVEYVQTP